MHNIQSPRSDEAGIEEEIKRKASTAPRLTPDHIDEQIRAVAFHRFPGTTTTVCLLTLRNGFGAVGHSACVSEENFDEAIGQKIAFNNARDKIWELEGYLLRDFLHANKSQLEQGLNGTSASDLAHVHILGEESGLTD
jgi:Phage protein (N4 Gp49/phage Sf6 gene 66) family